MGENTEIQWAHHSFNSHWGCQEVSGSRACANCYARVWAERFGMDLWGRRKGRRRFGKKHWDEPLKWDKKAEAAGEKHRVFAISMGDILENHPTVARIRPRLWELIDRTPNLIWLLLTKRPQNYRSMVPVQWLEKWPKNVWAGTTAEDQRWYDERLEHLASVPAPIIFMSMEPLMEPIDMRLGSVRRKVDWVITGCESGHRKRPTDWDWFRGLRDQCMAGGVKFFLKQAAVGKKVVGLPDLDGRTWDEVPEPVTIS